MQISAIQVPGPYLRQQRGEAASPTSVVGSLAPHDVEAHDVLELSAASQTAPSASLSTNKYESYLAAIGLASLSGPIAAVSTLTANDMMFHGTAIEFDKVEVRDNKRIGKGGVIDWEGKAIFATFDPRIALHYTAQRRTGVGTGIDLRNVTSADQPMVYSLDGGASKDEALDRVYGRAGEESSVGYIHLLDKSRFIREPGLGVMEMITRDEDAQLGRLKIDRRKAVDLLVASGAVIIDWTPGKGVPVNDPALMI